MNLDLVNEGFTKWVAVFLQGFLGFEGKIFE
jgi:hypothetical protein